MGLVHKCRWCGGFWSINANHLRMRKCPDRPCVFGEIVVRNKIVLIKKQNLSEYFSYALINNELAILLHPFVCIVQSIYIKTILC